MNTMLEKVDKEFVLPTYSRNYVNFKYGKNATLYSDTGYDYIDFTSGIGVVSVGHGNEQVAKTLYEQAKKIIHISNLYLIEPQAVLAKKIVELSGYDVKVFFSNSGAEANEGAIKMARKHGKTFEDEKFEIITLENSFHGRTLATLKATAQEKMHKHFTPYPDGFVYAKDLDDVYNKITDKTSAVMMELIQGEGGITPLDKQKVQELCRYLKEKNILLIIDEVQSGVFRTGKFLASNYYEIEPDIVTLAKGLGGGVPIGAILTRQKNIFEAGDHGSTFGGNYLCTATAIEVLNILTELKKSEKLKNTIDMFHEKLITLSTEFPDIFGEVVGIGLMKGVRVKSDELLAEIIKKAFAKRVLVLKSGRSTLRFLPPLTISQKELELGFERLHSAVSEI
ncbi:MAG: aspartate aminotransferase family protein [Campylobacterales bacterium]|nr:aspartate aminotransferase family protein [Campylobacterales bacterium]